MSPSILDIFLLSLFDRGLETPYDLQRQAGVSLGSSIPALRRLEAAGFIKKRMTAVASERPRHSYQLSAAGRKLARDGWVSFLKDQPPSDFDAVLRLADLMRHYNANASDIASFLNRAAKDRVLLSKRAAAGKDENGTASHFYAVTRNDWEAHRMATEANFLVRLAKSQSAGHRKKSKNV